ncbi:hypothetical protein DIX60_01200 [Streptococcus iniae]|uniref:hypothetical protein n=1 Tax=Streptococcus iniae TaxID=1346 RepID=UPI0008DA0D5F|nr:hypothetical protein [Streptococcus iniae]OHX27924.1 hypothetical protein BKX95_02895 [Streptococcus iniae]RLV28610.1 hypothetical protein DIX60_01200 [Streptococcus iniae]
MNKMKHLIALLATLLAVFLVTEGLDSSSTNKVSTKPNTASISKIGAVTREKELVKTENKTVKTLVKAYKDSDEAFINQILDYPDSQIVIANPDGGSGFFTNITPDFVGVGAVISHKDGKRVSVDTRSPDAATVGEIKAALRQAKMNKTEIN